MTQEQINPHDEIVALAHRRRRRSLPQSDAAAGIRLIIETTVAHVFMVRAEALQGPSRGVADVALARQVAMYLAHVVCGWQLVTVGRLFGRDRTTVAHGCALVENRRDDPRFDRTLDLLEEIVRRITEISPVTGEIQS